MTQIADWEKIASTLETHAEDVGDWFLEDAKRMAACCLWVYHDFTVDVDEQLSNANDNKMELLALDKSKYKEVEAPEDFVEIGKYWSFTGKKNAKRVVIALFGTLGRGSKKHYVVICRGTQTMGEWQANINAGTTSFSIELGQKKQGHGKVHKGFLSVYEDFRKSLMNDLKQIQVLNNEIPRLLVTGHSLGGALSTLAAYEISIRFSHKFNVRLYNFASPRVGKNIFRDNFNKQVNHAFRFVNSKDIVPKVPPKTPYFENGFHHVATPFTFRGNKDKSTVDQHDMLYYRTQLEKPSSWMMVELPDNDDSSSDSNVNDEVDDNQNNNNNPFYNLDDDDAAYEPNPDEFNPFEE